MNSGIKNRYVFEHLKDRGAHSKVQSSFRKNQRTNWKLRKFTIDDSSFFFHTLKLVDQRLFHGCEKSPGLDFIQDQTLLHFQLHSEVALASFPHFPSLCRRNLPFSVQKSLWSHHHVPSVLPPSKQLLATFGVRIHPLQRPCRLHSHHSNLLPTHGRVHRPLSWLQAQTGSSCAQLPHLTPLTALLSNCYP